MIYLFICLIVVLIAAYFLKNNNLKKSSLNEDPKLFSTEEFIDRESIKSAKCPQCGKIAMTYDDVKENFGLRKVGHATDIQSWCRECRRDKEEIKKNKPEDENLTLFNE